MPLWPRLLPFIRCGLESVAWVSERKDVLSGLFFMLTLLMYVRYVKKSKVQSPKFATV